jgi:excisionase family DNA binding protein
LKLGHSRASGNVDPAAQIGTFEKESIESEVADLIGGVGLPMSEPQKREWLTVTDITQRLPVSGRTVINEIRAGRLRGRRFGRKWLVHESDLERYMDESTQVALREEAAEAVS